MRKQTAILLVLLILCGALWFTQNLSILTQPETIAPETVEPVPSVSASAVPPAAEDPGFFSIPVLSGARSQPQTVASESGAPIRSSVDTSADPLATAGTGFSKIPFFAGPLPELSGNKGRAETFRERVFTKALPKLIADKEGSYTNLSELFRSDGTVSVDLQSDWAARRLFPSRNLPALRVRIIKNPETGEYEPVGGALTLPGGSWEAGFEVDPARDENKATLQWKKSF
jgi:hypothetical protein